MLGAAALCICVAPLHYACVWRRCIMHMRGAAALCMCVAPLHYACAWRRCIMHVRGAAALCMCVAPLRYACAWRRAPPRLQMSRGFLGGSCFPPRFCRPRRDADRVAGLLEANSIFNVKLLVNRVRPDMIQSNDMMSVKDVQAGRGGGRGEGGAAPNPPGARGAGALHMDACRCGLRRGRAAVNTGRRQRAPVQPRRPRPPL
jgi:hypothetical protein